MKIAMSRPDISTSGRRSGETAGTGILYLYEYECTVTVMEVPIQILSLPANLKVQLYSYVRWVAESAQKAFATETPPPWAAQTSTCSCASVLWGVRDISRTSTPDQHRRNSVLVS